MENQKNEDIKEYNELWFKRDQDNKIKNSRVNPKLLLFKSNGFFKNNLRIENTKKSVNFKFSVKQNNSTNNIRIFYNKSYDKKSKNSFFMNKRKRPFSSNFRQNNIKQKLNPTTFRSNSSNSSIDMNNIAKSLNRKQRDNSINILTKSRMKAYIKGNKLYPSTSFHNPNNALRFTIKLKNSSNPSDYYNFRYFNNNNNNNNNNKISLESKKESNSSSAFDNLDKIASDKNLNIRIFQQRNKNRTQNNIFRQNFNSKNINNLSQTELEKKIFNRNYNKINNNSIINNRNNNNYTNDLVLYKNVIYTNTPNKRNKNLINKLRNYNNEIRIRNDIKNIQYKSQEKSNKKRYSFYKYEEYMDKINKEEINLYKYNLKKMKEINIQEIFQDKNKSPKNATNKSKPRFKDKSKTSNKEDLLQSSNSLSASNILDCKSVNNSHENSPRYIRIPIKKLESTKSKSKYRKDNIDDSSSEMPMVINNYEVKKTGIRKLRRTLTMINLKNIYVKKFKEENILLDSDRSNESCPNKLSVKINQSRKKDLLNLSDNVQTEKKNHKIKSIKFDKIKTIEEKKTPKKMKENEIFENLRKHYFQKREKMIKANRRNLLAQKLLLEKIAQMDKKDENKPLSKFSPFSNLNYKYEEKDDIKRKQKIIDKYYKKNQDKNKYSVRLKNKSSMSFLTNNSINTSHFNFMKEFNDQKSEFFSIHDFFGNENSPRNFGLKDKDIINFDSNENNFNLKEIENIDNKINFEENKNEIEENKRKEEERRLKIKLDEEKLNNLINEERKKKFENNFFQNYENIIKSQEKKEKKIKQDLITDEMLQEMSHNFLNLLEENEKIIKSSEKMEDAELFVEFREKMNSLQKYSKRELNLYVYRNIQTISSILEECKRDKQIENRINKFLKLLRDDFDDLYLNRKFILKFLKAIDYNPYINHTMDSS